MVSLSTRTRIRELDALRGFAVGGIMLVNTWQHARHEPATGIDWTIDTLLQSRFYPIFSLLFGISFVLFLQGADRGVLLRRLFWLMVFGLIQHSWYTGEVLIDYAFFGALVLVPASFLPGGVPVLVLGLALLGWSVANDGGSLPLGLPSIVPTGPLLIPAAFLIGMGLMRLEPSRRLLAPAFAVSAVAGAVLVVAWVSTGDWSIYLAAAVAGAAAYSTGLLLALRPWLSALLEPLGKMALTNYISGTLIIFLATPLLDTDLTRWSVIAVTAGTLAVQVLFSRWWLGRYRYGPLEWIWRCLTWFRYVPNRLESGRDENRPLPDPGVT
ncbi:DUF418 domain-containing protein [Nonomuraea glycinis]|uniref:DUF418 domain-containing protein n=2 Tax=Nonomuraea glycinis TaxID=2047744 RepID=A0A918EAW0_9ACTN|nr:DUF418 domain-containing protein [Nonomuraea glycinis]MCA2182476.1 DUF418 domain-containing protein [Nonomuraea glycinis]GGP16266.1 hypothetical protein GCM10012278_79360 [Nonomuraea glycinis]